MTHQQYDALVEEENRYQSYILEKKKMIYETWFIIRNILLFAGIPTGIFLIVSFATHVFYWMFGLLAIAFMYAILGASDEFDDINFTKYWGKKYTELTIKRKLKELEYNKKERIKLIRAYQTEKEIEALNKADKEEEKQNFLNRLKKE
jgi:hypothetical protein